MGVDTSIYQNILAPKIQSPFEIAQGAAQINALQGQNRMADLNYGQAQQDVQSQNALSQLLAGGKSGNDVVQGLAAQGFGKKALDYNKSMLDQQKTQADIGHLGAQTAQANATAAKTTQETKFDAAVQHAKNIVNVQSPQDVVSYVDDGIKSGVFPAQLRDQMLQKAASYPSLDAWKQAQIQAAIPVIDRYKVDAENSRNTATNQTHILTTKMSNDTSRANNASTIAGENIRAGYDGSGNPTGDLETTARAIANGQLPPPSGMALTNPKNQRILSRVMEINPQYDFTDVTAKKKAASDFTSGNQGNAMRSFAVAGQHLDQLGSLVDALDNRDTQLFNKIGNQYSTQTGNAAPTNFNAAKDVVAKEVMKAIVGGGGGVSEREELSKSMSQVSSPAQLKGVIAQYRNLMSAQHDALLEQRRAAGLPDSTLPKYNNTSNPSNSSTTNDIHAQADAILRGK